ncbi:MAG: TonB-dependent receptor [Sediminibacterium sp. Gen4]|jgi:iron complex outermembrane recepter protein|uniref:outer membrane beta-barrel family protein n=1 Tax=unclassified Sediminibacterium TaxID=2635961 RepID=UPI0015C0488D|nr:MULTISPECIES: outer membrane beta-barrel family protein [unclassified Sediminibacterium]MBW0156161.1 TonB-dependent receptor [Candidatus Methylopumilus sp.]MBW0164239.1 TonB-dependent receptor [Sediminibacterium sp.]NWK65469.1 TonB-dependent receptor [Sediminibacterium sp. Gen4]
MNKCKIFCAVRKVKDRLQIKQSSPIKFFLLFVLVFWFGIATAQNTDNIRGSVIDEKKEAVYGATAMLYKTGDSTLVKAIFTDKDGGFLFEKVKPGRYFVVITMIGYKKHFSETFSIKNASIDLPVILLTVESKILSQVIVQARKPLFEQKADKFVVNVDASPVNAGASALEILEKSPGITVDKDGNVSLKGKAGVQFFIDGKPAYISGQDLVNYLSNLNGNLLDQIEIMTNPPAKYDAAGNSGIINIKTKRTKQIGYIVNLSTGYTLGIYGRNNQSVNFNYRKNKINIFGNISRNQNKILRTYDINRQFVDRISNQVTAVLNQSSDKLNNSTVNEAKIGADIYFNSKTNAGVVFTGFNNPGSANSEGIIYVRSPSGTVQQRTLADTRSVSRWKNFNGNINLRHLFDSIGRELSIDLDYLRYDQYFNQDLVSNLLQNSGGSLILSDTLLGNLPLYINIYSAKADFVHPMKKGAKLEAGVKIAYVETDANAIYDSVINNTLIPDAGRSNHFVYDERISAAYLNYSKSFSSKINGTFGLRAENTLAHGNQITTGETFKLAYTKLFPTMFLQYKADKSNSLNLNYGRRIRRPDYESLNPFMKFLDKYTFEQGNPRLQPQFSHNIELSHAFKGWLTTTFNYTSTNNIIQMVLEQNETTKETFARQDNIASLRQIGVSILAYKQVKNISANLFVNAYQNEFKGMVNNTFLELKAATVVLNGTLSYKFKKGLVVETSGFYRTAGVEGVFTIQPLGAIHFGLSMPVLKNAGSLRLAARDIFWTQKAKGSSRFGTVDAAFKQTPDSRTIGLQFAYRITKGKTTNNKRKNGSASDEQGRVKISD